MASYLCIHNQPSDKSRCVGSSHGWLILLNQQTPTHNLYLLNPSSGAQILLPTFPQSLIHKAVLSANPATTTNGYTVVVTYGFESNVAFFNMGTRGSLVSQDQWRGLDVKHVTDVICYNGLVFTLDEGCNIGVWNVRFTVSARKFADIKPSFPSDAFEYWESKRDLCSSRWYLVVESSGDLLIVCRVVGEYVRDGEPISEADLLDGETNHPLVCPYRTLSFQVYRLNGSKNEWEEVKSIGENRVLFLGVNQSTSVSTGQVPGCEGNSIYFTDDYWERMDEDYLYGGHDLGVYSIRDNNVKDVCEFDSERIQPPPVWLLPIGSC